MLHYEVGMDDGNFFSSRISPWTGVRFSLILRSEPHLLVGRKFPKPESGLIDDNLFTGLSTNFPEGSAPLA